MNDAAARPGPRSASVAPSDGRGGTTSPATSASGEAPEREVKHVAMVSVHTSPLSQPGTGDAGGLNVYVVETAKRLAQRGVAVDIFTRRTSASVGEQVELAPGVTVHHIAAGPYEGLGKDDLPGQLCAFAAGMMRVGASKPEGYYDLVHSHYWLSGQVGWLAADRWRVPLIHTMHTMARVKNSQLAAGDTPEPAGREIGEEQVVDAATTLVANTPGEARELIDLYGADPARVTVVTPGVDLDVFSAGDDIVAERHAARAELGFEEDADVVLFVGRIQPLKAPDVLVRAVARMIEDAPWRREKLRLVIVGGPSGSGLDKPLALQALARELGVKDVVDFVPPVSRRELVTWFHATDVVAVPSHSESFGLVAIEASASGTPVVAAAVGGLPTAVGDGGVLVDGHDPAAWAQELAALLDDPPRIDELGRRAARHAQDYSWDASVDKLLAVYEDACRRETSSYIDASRALAGVPSAIVP